MPQKVNPEHGDDKDYYYGSYNAFAWKFRLWLVAYGVSIPFIVLTNDKMRALVVTKADGPYYLKMSLWGVVFQIFLTWSYKVCMWYCDRHAKGYLPVHSIKYKCATWFSEQFFIEILLDATSVTLFLISTFKLLEIVT
jgi:hypothetical protein